MMPLPVSDAERAEREARRLQRKRERARRYRLRHPEKAAADLAKLRTYPAKRKNKQSDATAPAAPATPTPVIPDTPMSDDLDPHADDAAALPDAHVAKTEGMQPQADSQAPQVDPQPDPRALLLAEVSRLQQMAAASDARLAAEDLGERQRRAEERHRAGLGQKLAAMLDKLARLPVVKQPDNWLAQYQGKKA